MPPAKYPCLKCGEQCKKGEAAVQCGLCEQWGHPKCVQISKEFLAYLSNKDPEETVCWYCQSCKVNTIRINKELKLINLNQEKIKEDLESTKARVKTLEEKVAKSDKFIEDQKQTINKDAIVGATMEALEEESNEREARRANLIFHQIPEVDQHVKDGSNRKERDIETVGEILEAIECTTDLKSEAKFCVRVGKISKEESTPRPILVCFKESKVRDKILESARKLKNHRKFGKVSIVPDLTVTQRKHEDKMRSEVRKKNEEMDKEEAGDWEWALVGPRGARRMIRRRRRMDNQPTYQERDRGANKRSRSKERDSPNNRPQQRIRQESEH